MGKAFSIIIPVLNEAEGINQLIDHLKALEHSEEAEFIVVDGDPDGSTVKALIHPGIHRISSRKGRSIQMNDGAAMAEGEILIFLHADTRLPCKALSLIGRAMTDQELVGGAFDLRIDTHRPLLQMISLVASLRSRLTRIPYGDQALFIRRDYFHRIGQYPEIPLMEDVAIMQRIKKTGGRIHIFREPVVTSARRWESEGILFTTARNWLLLSAYCLGVSPDILARHYPSGKGSGEVFSKQSRLSGNLSMQRNCLIVFIKSPEAGSVKSRLAAAIGEQEACRLYRHFVLDLLESLGRGDYCLKLFFSPPDQRQAVSEWLGKRRSYEPQAGGDLGERMKHAFGKCFSTGFERVILIGSDIPDLPREIIDLGFDSLKERDVVMGPSQDGGYYLIGFRADTFTPDAFAGISWSTDSVRKNTRDVLEKRGLSVAILPQRRDVDRYDDLLALMERNRNTAFARSRTIRYALSQQWGNRKG